MFRFRSAAPTGTSGGPETDPVAMPALNAHKVLADAHGDRAYADGRIAALVNAAPTALDTLAEIDAQMQSDESGAAAMQAAINARALTTDLNAHITDPDAAHAASAVSVAPSGLAVVTTTDVQSALAQLDAWANGRPRHDGGLDAARPANGAWPNGSTWLSTDIAGGTTFRMLNGAWVQEAAGVLNSSGQLLAGPVQMTAALNLAGTTQTDIPGMSIAVPASARPVLVRAKLEWQMNTGTAAAGNWLRVQAWLADAVTNAVLSFGAGNAISIAATGVLWEGQISLELYLPAPVAANTYKLRANMNAASPANWGTNTLLPNNGQTGTGADNLYAVAC